MPTDEGIGLDVHQGVTPGEQAAQNYHNQPSGIISALWLHLALLEQGELFTQEEVLGCQRAARPRNEHQETDEITCDEGQRGEAVYQRLKDGAGNESQPYTLRDVTRLTTGGWTKFSAEHSSLCYPCSLLCWLGSYENRYKNRYSRQKTANPAFEETLLS